MSKQQYVLIGGIMVAVLALGGSGIWYWHSHQTDDHIGPGMASLQAASTIGGSAGATQTPDQTSAPQLSANSSSSAGLGQLTLPGSSNGNSNTASSNTQSGGTGSSSASSLLDPSTFGQYDKYKTGTEALFADVQAGTGTALTSGHQANVYYKGWLTNGQVFDQSRAGSDGQLQPFSFTLGEHQVIPGWEEGLTGMKSGGVRFLVIPPSVGYGATGQGSIPGNSVLIFEVQLLSVK